MIVIGISENAIIFLEVKILIDKSEIADYLSRAKKLIVQNKFSIALNSNRMTNLSLFDEYLIDEERIKIILLDLTEVISVKRFKISMFNFNMSGCISLEKRFL